MLSLALFAPLVGAIVLALVPGLRVRGYRWAAAAVAAIPLILLTVVWLGFEGTGGFEAVESAAWIPSLGVAYRVGVDGISLVLAALTALVFFVSILYPVDLKGRAKEYFSVFLFLETASLGVFLALDLFLFYVFWDLTLVGMFFVIGIWGHGEERKRAALKFFLYTLLGSLAILLAILGLYLSSDPRTFDMAELIRQTPLDGAGWSATLVFAGFALGFAIKTPLFPFHTWLPPAHVDAPGPGSAVLAGVLLKMGTYGFVRILLSMMPGTFAAWAPWLGAIALISILYGALVAFAQKSLKRRIAYTSVNHMGYAVLGIAAAGGLLAGEEAARAVALTGATVEMVAHGVVTGALFLMAGSVWQRAETYEIDAFGGLAKVAPWLTGFFVLAAFASMGLPGLAQFVAEFQVFVGAFSVYPWLAAFGLLGILITAALFLHLLQRVFLGELPERWTGWSRLDVRERVALGLLALFIVLIGVLPGWLLDPIHSAATTIVGR